MYRKNIDSIFCFGELERGHTTKNKSATLYVFKQGPAHRSESIYIGFEVVLHACCIIIIIIKKQNTIFKTNISTQKQSRTL